MNENDFMAHPYSLRSILAVILYDRSLSFFDGAGVSLIGATAVIRD
jgi:hypothetical protein